MKYRLLSASLLSAGLLFAHLPSQAAGITGTWPAVDYLFNVLAPIFENQSVAEVVVPENRRGAGVSSTQSRKTAPATKGTNFEPAVP
jgi:hypothetical protein